MKSLTFLHAFQELQFVLLIVLSSQRYRSPPACPYHLKLYYQKYKEVGNRNVIKETNQDWKKKVVVHGKLLVLDT
jgi:hypothetical protein